MKENNSVLGMIQPIIMGFIVLFSSFTSQAQQPFISVPEVKIHHLKSRFVDQEFEILVSMPIGIDGESEHFPVLYCTDSNTFFPRNIIHRLQLGEVPRFIVVGIGYPLKHSLGAVNLRNRDLTPVDGVLQIPPVDKLIRDIPVPRGKKLGGAPEFLKFIREELIPFIDKNYPTIPGERGLWGDSFGGLFGLYVLLNNPDTFNKYIIGSPSAWWADEYIIKQAEAYVAAHDELNASVYMSVGALEEIGSAPNSLHMVTNVSRIESILKKKDLKGLELSTRVFPDETHLSVAYINFMHGLKAVYGRPEVSFIQTAFKKYTKSLKEQKGQIQ